MRLPRLNISIGSRGLRVGLTIFTGLLAIFATLFRCTWGRRK